MKPGFDEAARRLGELIRAHRPEIERRWLASVRAHLPAAAGLPPSLLRDGLPRYLETLSERLLGNAGGAITEHGEVAWAAVAREHGVTRVHLGFDITQLIREFLLLRHAIRDVCAEQGLDLAEVAAILADLLDAGIATAVQAYVEHRDHVSRAAQAKHIGFLTHELRNPLATAMLAAARVRQRATAEQTRALDALDRSHRRLSDLIASVLLSERLASGNVQSEPSELKLGELIETATEASRALATQKGLAFRTTYDPDALVRLDPTLTRSAIQNLVDNAAKYTDSGHVELSVEIGSGVIVIHVRDSGPGIRGEELRKVFEPFERGTTNKEGTGLGLTICRQAVEVQGGSIHAESPPGGGCHFWIVLPRASG